MQTKKAAFVGVFQSVLFSGELTQSNVSLYLSIVGLLSFKLPHNGFGLCDRAGFGAQMPIIITDF